MHTSRFLPPDCCFSFRGSASLVDYPASHCSRALRHILSVIFIEQSRKARFTTVEPAVAARTAAVSVPLCAAYIVAGLVFLVFGADFLVEGASNIARSFGVSEAAIGLTVVAVGTSLPELATSVMAAVRKHSDVSLGNVVGSNIFNLLGILGITAIISPVAVNPVIGNFDLPVMILVTLAFAGHPADAQDNSTLIWSRVYCCLRCIHSLAIHVTRSNPAVNRAQIGKIPSDRTVTDTSSTNSGSKNAHRT